MLMKKFRQWHRYLAPVMILPIVLTAITGSLFEIADLAGQDKQYKWLLNLHKGHFGPLNLEVIYPFLNTLGILVLAFTGMTMWWRMRKV
jgi:uncharacterized iron-regulated membrane protein